MLGLTVLLTACGVTVGTGDTYDWHSSYVKQLYLNRGDISEQEYAEYLQEIADDADSKEPRTLPPGFYAGLGLAWYRAGDLDKATMYLNKEATVWPEAKVASKVATWLQEDFKPQLTGPKGQPDEAKAPKTSEASVKDKAKTDTSSSANQVIVDMKPNTRTR